MKKTLMLIFLILILSGCSTTYSKYHFAGRPINHIPNKEYEYQEYIYIYGEGADVYDENSPLSKIVVGTKPFNIRNLEIVDKEVKIVYRGKEYHLPTINEHRAIVIIDVHELNITNDVEIHLGKAKVGDAKISGPPLGGGRTLDVPPIKLKTYIKIIKVNPLLDGLNIDTKKTIYLGPLEDYKEKK